MATRLPIKSAGAKNFFILLDGGRACLHALRMEPFTSWVCSDEGPWRRGTATDDDRSGVTVSDSDRLVSVSEGTLHTSLTPEGSPSTHGGSGLEPGAE